MHINYGNLSISLCSLNAKMMPYSEILNIKARMRLLQRFWGMEKKTTSTQKKSEIERQFTEVAQYSLLGLEVGECRV